MPAGSPRNPVQEANRLGQSIWYDNVSRALIQSGELARLINLGVTGLTSNPTIFEKAISSASDYDAALAQLTRAGASTLQAYEALAIEDIRAVADLLAPIHRETQGLDGYASLECNPALAADTAGTVAEGQRLFAALHRPNVMIKVPATPEGIPAIRQLIAQGVNVNVTLIFSVKVHAQVMEAYLAGLEDLQRRGGNLSAIASVASFFVSRFDTLLDPELDRRVAQGDKRLAGLQGKAAIANAKVAYQAFLETFGQPRFQTLAATGARVQRPLWGSTSTKNPAYPDLLYVDNLIGPQTVNTVPPATLAAFLDHGQPHLTLDQAPDAARHLLQTLQAAGIDLDAATAKLLDDGVKAFASSFDSLLRNVSQKRDAILAS